MIVPISITCSKRMQTAQTILCKKGIYISNFGWRPAKLFEGSKKANLSISILLSSNKLELFSSTYNRWYSDERENLFNKIKYVNVKEKKYLHIIPKISEKIEASIFSKVITKETIETKVSSFATKYVLYYRRTGGLYWKIFTDFQPIVYQNGKKTFSSKEAILYFKNENDLKISIALLWSNLYWWWYIINSDERNNNPSDLKSFPIDNNIYNDKRLIKISSNLIEDLKEYSIWDIRQYQGNESKFQKFFPKHSKQIIDEIDLLISDYYGFTKDETDFLINFDLRFRMGDENNDNDEIEEE